VWTAAHAAPDRRGADEDVLQLAVEPRGLAGVARQPLGVRPAQRQPVGCAAGQAAAAVARGADGGVLATGAAVGGGAERGVVISGHRSPRRGGGVWCMVSLR